MSLPKLTLNEQMDRFIKSGFKQGHFTNELYEMLYIETNVFIAHFNKAGFYERRFKNDAHITISTLRLVKKPSIKLLCLKLALAMENALKVEITEQKRIHVA